jgi:hypothetical protein
MWEHAVLNGARLRMSVPTAIARAEDFARTFGLEIPILVAPMSGTVGGSFSTSGRPRRMRRIADAARWHRTVGR